MRVTGTIQESIDIRQDATVDGVVQGSVTIHGPAVVTLKGRIQGTTSVGSGSELIILGAQEGTVLIALGAVVLVEEGGKLAGSLHNDGRLILRGVLGGISGGSGSIEIEGHGWIRPPDEMRDGMAIYRW